MLKKLLATLGMGVFIFKIGDALFDSNVSLTPKILIILMFVIIINLIKYVPTSKSSSFNRKELDKVVRELKVLINNYSYNQSSEEDKDKWGKSIDRLSELLSKGTDKIKDCYEFYYYQDMYTFAVEIYQLYLQKHFVTEVLIKDRDYISGRMVYIDHHDEMTLILANEKDRHNEKTNINFKEYIKKIIDEYLNNEHFNKVSIYPKVRMVVTDEKIITYPLDITKHRLY